MDSTNIFALARRRGMQTVVAGPLLPYCEMLGEWLSECRSFSIYNYASVNRRLAFYNPIFTNIILWPRQFPTGLLKGVVYSVWQKGVIEQSFEIASKALERRGPLFLFVHFSVPHLPFVFDRDGYYRNPTPFLQNRENYLKQLEYADALFGKLMMTVKKRGAYGSSDIVVLSDHNYRIMFPEKKDEIPLIVKRANQGVRHDVYEPARAEEVIRAIVER